MHKPTSQPQLGFSPIGFLIVVAVVVLLGVVGWRVWDSKQKNKIQTSTKQSTIIQNEDTSQLPAQNIKDITLLDGLVSATLPSGWKKKFETQL